VPKLAVRGGTPVRTKPWPKWPQCGKKEIDLISKVTASGNWSFDGPLEHEFARRFAEFAGVKHAVLVANGTVSLEIALKALDIVPGDEVIVPPTTWYATATAVINIGAVAVFADIDPETYCIDPRAVEAAITKRTRAIIPVHLYCCLADMDALRRIARRYKLKIIEDCAHTHGSRWRGKGAGSIGDIGSFSFQQSKVLTSGEGGAVTTDSDKLAARLYSLKNCGRLRSEGDEQIWGHNYRITEFQAAILLAQLSRFPAQFRRREANALYLDGLLNRIPGIKPMKRHKQIDRQSYYIYAFRYNSDEFGGLPLPRFIEAVRAEGVPVDRINDPVYRGSLFASDHHTCLHAHRLAGRHFDYAKLRLPVAERAYEQEGVCFHNPPLLGTKRDVRDIADAIAKVRENYGELI
jgi:L-glutamine:2-deoxy-scyllo-inosose/3-amino-2,3-dideoxy-scyllo-inosose aminotransferase